MNARTAIIVSMAVAAIGYVTLYIMALAVDDSQDVDMYGQGLNNTSGRHGPFVPRLY